MGPPVPIANGIEQGTIIICNCQVVGLKLQDIIFNFGSISCFSYFLNAFQYIETLLYYHYSKNALIINIIDAFQNSLVALSGFSSSQLWEDLIKLSSIGQGTLNFSVNKKNPENFRALIWIIFAKML